MKRFKLSRREWMLFLFPCFFLGLPYLNNLREMDTSQLSLSLNPFARARENARGSSCQSNLKQLGLGFQMYQQDYDGRFPLNNSPKAGWANALVTYTKSCPILQCPSEPTSPTPMVPDYWMNGNLNDAKHGGRGLSDKELERPDNTFLLGDFDGAKSRPNITLTEKSWQSKAPYARRHLLGANYLWADGHVKNVQPNVVNGARKSDACCTPYAFKTEILGVGHAKHLHPAGAAHAHEH